VWGHLGGPLPDAQYLTATDGGTLTANMDKNSVIFERSIPLQKALKEYIQAWKMNGDPIPLIHGGPLRLMVRGILHITRLSTRKLWLQHGRNLPLKFSRQGISFEQLARQVILVGHPCGGCPRNHGSVRQARMPFPINQ